MCRWRTYVPKSPTEHLKWLSSVASGSLQNWQHQMQISEPNEPNVKENNRHVRKRDAPPESNTASANGRPARPPIHAGHGWAIFGFSESVAVLPGLPKSCRARETTSAKAQPSSEIADFSARLQSAVQTFTSHVAICRMYSPYLRRLPTLQEQWSHQRQGK